MIALENGAHRADYCDEEEFNVSSEGLPSGEGAAVFSSMFNDETGWLVILLDPQDWWREDEPWTFNLHMSFENDGQMYAYDSWTSVPRDDEKVALKVEEELTEAFNTLVREVKAGKDPKSVAERYGFDQVDINKAL